MGAAVQADTDGVDVLLDGGLHHHLRSLPQPGVDYLDPGVTQRARHHFDPAVVPVEADLGGEDSGCHDRITYSSTMTTIATTARARPIREKRMRII